CRSEVTVNPRYGLRCSRRPRGGGLPASARRRDASSGGAARCAYREAVAWLPALANAEKSSGAVKLVGGVLDGPPGEAIAQHLADDFELPLVDFGWPDKPWNRPFQLRRMIREKFDALTLIFENCFGGRVIVSFNRIDSGLMRRRSWLWSCCWPSALSWRGPSASSNGSAGTREIDSVHRDPLASASPVSFSDLGECADPRFEPGGQPQGDQGHDRVPEGIAQLDPVHQNDVVDRGDLALLHQRDDGMEEVAKTALGGAQARPE